MAAILDARQLLVGAEATADRVIEAATTAGIIHLACHGRFSRESPVTSGLKLADRWLTVREIFGMRLRADLVTLSGCDTGRTVIGRGDELVGLLRGFLAAGAVALVVSLWTVNDESAAELIVRFYDARRTGRTWSAALHLAQRDLLVERPHPAFWAPFMIGDRP